MNKFKGINTITIDGVVLRKTLVRYLKRKRKFVLITIMYEPRKTIACVKFGGFRFVESFFNSFNNNDVVRITGRISQSKIETIIIIKNITVLSRRT